MHRILQYIALILIFTALAGGYWYWQSQAAVRVNQGLEDSLEQGLVGYWKLDDASGTTATDSSGNDNNGTLTNGPTWSTGQVGGAVTFDGVDDYISATLNTPAPNLTICSWVRPSDVTGQRIIVDNQDHLRLEINGSKFRTHFGDGVSWGALVDGATDLSNNNWYFACGIRSGANTTLYVNGVRDGSGTDAATVVGGTGIFIGRYTFDLSHNFVGNIDETRVYNRPLSDEEVKKLYQTTAPTGIDTGLVGYWPFDGDDISGTIASDRSGKGNHGTITSGTTKTLGKAGQALDFSAGNGVQIDSLTQTGQTYTFATWAKVTSCINEYIFDTVAGRLVLACGNRVISYYDGTWKSVGSANSIPLNEWVHLVWVLNSSSGIATGYINGVSVGTNSYVGTNIGTNTRIGSYFGGGGAIVQGALDDFRVYNRALTAADVQDLYQKTQSDTVGASNKRDSLALGLAGYWKLDDASGTTATDSSTNGNNGTLTNGPTWGTGQIQGAANFDGVDDYIDAGSPTNLDNLPVFSASAWIYQPTASVGYRKIISKGENNFTASCPNGGWCLSTNGTELNFGLAYASGNLLKRANSGVVPFDQWNHVVVTWDGTASSSGTHMYVNGFEVTYASQSSGSGARISDASWNVSLGALHGGAQTFYGKIDETRIYNRVLTADEASRLYRTTAPTGVDTGLKGYWSFDGDDISGTTATDLSGAGNHGTLTNGPTKTIGKMGQALNFNGTNQYAEVPHQSYLNSYPLTVSAWFKTSGSSNGSIVNKYPGGSLNGYQIHMYNGQLCAWYFKDGSNYIYDNSSNCTFYLSGYNDNNWHQATFVVDASGGKLYVDGILGGSLAWTGTPGATTTTQQLSIGNFYVSYFPGSIDEVRAYNRALSIDEVREVYDYGKADKINTAGSDPLTDGLAGYWKLDDASGTTATDSSGNGNNGTLANGPAWSTAGQVAGALSFDGVDDYATVPYSSSLVGTDKLSYSFWIKPDLNESTGILGSLNGEDGTGYNFIIIDNNGTELNNPAINIYRNIGGTSTNRTVSFPSSTNTWIHGVYTYDGTTERWYINGSKRGEWAQAGTFATNTESGLLLGMPYSIAPGYKGLIDEVRVYKRALTTEDVAQLYRTTAPTGVDTGLVGYWPFDGDDFSGTTTYDRSGKGNNGTLTSGPTKTIGKIGQALNFDGTDDFVITSHLAALNAYPITVSTWVKTGVNDATRRYILNKYNFPNGYVINLLSGKIRTWYLTGNSVTDYVYDGSEGMSSKAVVSDNQWHLVTFTVDAAGGKLYIDGTLEDSMAWTGTPQATSNTEGIRWSAVVTGGDKIAASLDETRIYNRALTSAEIQNLYLKGR